MHIRGIDIAYVEQAVGEKLVLDGFDKAGEKMFIEVPSKLRRYAQHICDNIRLYQVGFG